LDDSAARNRNVEVAGLSNDAARFYSLCSAWRLLLRRHCARQRQAEVRSGNSALELVAAGLLTADGFDNLRALIDPKRRSAKEADAVRVHDTVRTLVAAPLGRDPRSLQSTRTICWMLLRRYGIVFRELLTRESILPKWRTVDNLRRLEDRGEVRAAASSTAFLGAVRPTGSRRVFARHAASAALGETITISAADPLNLVGMVSLANVSPPIPVSCRFRDGVAVQFDERRRYSNDCRG